MSVSAAGSQDFRLRLESIPQVLWFSAFQIPTLAFLGLQLADGNTWKKPSIVLNNFKLGKSPREQEPANPGSRRQQLCPFLLEHVDMWLNGYSPRPLHSQYMFQGARISLAQRGSGQDTELTNHG